MKRLFIGILTAALVGGLALAQDTSPFRPERPGGRKSGPRGERQDRPERPMSQPASRPGERLAAMFDQLASELALTDDQKTQIRQVFDTFRQDQANWEKQQESPRELDEQIRKARQAKDETALKALREKIEKKNAERLVMFARLHDQVAAVLTDEQKTKLEAFWAEKVGKVKGPIAAAMKLNAALQGLNLTDEQKAKIEAIKRDSAAQAEKAPDQAAREEIWKKTVDQVRGVLTADQVKTFDQRMAKPLPGLIGFRPFAGLQLTDDQRRQITKLLEDANAKAKDAAPDQRRQIRREAMAKIRNDVLTSEQRQQLPKPPPPGPPPGADGDD